MMPKILHGVVARMRRTQTGSAHRSCITQACLGKDPYVDLCITHMARKDAPLLAQMQIGV